MRKKRILSLLLSLAVCIAFMPAAVFADGETGGGTAGATQAAIKTVSTSNEFEEALKNSSIDEIHITADIEYKNKDVDTDKRIVIESGKKLTWGGSKYTFQANQLSVETNAEFIVYTYDFTYKTTVRGNVDNNGTITASGSGKCYWEAATTGNGTFNASSGTSYINYGTIPTDKISGNNYKINIVKNVSETPEVNLPADMQTGQTVKPVVTNLIAGVDIAKVFDFKWMNASSYQIYKGETNPTLTDAGTLKLTLSTKTPYVMRTESGTRGSIETSGTVTQALSDTVYVDATNGNDSNLGNAVGKAVRNINTAIDKVSENGTVVLTGDYETTGYALIKKSVTVKSLEDNTFKLSLNSLGGIKINSGATVTFDNVTINNTKFSGYASSGSTGDRNIAFKNCNGENITIANSSNNFANISFEKSVLSGSFYAATKLALDVSTVSGKFTTKDFTAKGNCRLNLKRSAPAVIKGSVDFKDNALITISTENPARGEKLIEVPSGTDDKIVGNFKLADTQNDKYALKCRETYNGTYIGISECISIDDGKLAVAYEPAIGNDVIDTTSNGNKYVTFNPGNVVGVTSGTWSGYINSAGKKWSLDDNPELTVVLSAGMDSDFYHFDDNFLNDNLKVYTWGDVNNLPDYQNQNKNVTIDKKQSQGVSNDGRTFIFTVTYPKVARLTQTITVDKNNLDLKCKGEATRQAAAPGTVTYSSSNPEVATVDSNGKVTAITAGSATITVSAEATDTYEAASATYTVTVKHNYGTEYKHDDTNHWKECACGAKTEEAAHSGGTADCVTKAKCEVCAASYGAVDASNHKGPMSYTANNSATHKKTCDACKAVVAAEENHNFVNNVCSECGYKRVTGGGSYNPAQKPEIITGEGGKTSLENNGSTLVITPDEGMEISKVTVNGKEVTVTNNKITGLKTGDKVEVTFAKTPPTKEETDNIFKGKALKLSLAVRTSKTTKKNIRVAVKKTKELKYFIRELADAGYTVKYKFYRSVKKTSKYKARIVKTTDTYINTAGKKGRKYYYKAKLLIYDNGGRLIAQTELKQCKYGFRTWTK